MKYFSTLFLTFLMAVLSHAQGNIYNEILNTHVTDDGVVNYEGLKKDSAKLDAYLQYLEETQPLDEWSQNKKMAFWINAYNAYTLKLIIDNYPVSSIMDIQPNGASAWKFPFAKVGGKSYTLDEIEHDILRKKFFDPRIHVAVNCASISCPILSNKAFREDTIQFELEQLMKKFINDPSRNKISPNSISISQIFNWFRDDFTKEKELIDYINSYANILVKANAKIDYLPYNWNLNAK